MQKDFQGIRRGSEDDRKRLYFIHLDIKNFFMTIDKDILYRMLAKKVKVENLLLLAYVKKLAEGIPVVIIRETDRYIGRIKERLPIMKLTKTKEEKKW